MRPIDSTQPASSNLGPVVFSEDQIRDRVTELAAELSRDHTDKIPVIIRGPASVRVCALLSRPQRRLIEVPLDYVGFAAPDDFLVGYGMHYRQQYRQLPYIASCRVNGALP